MNITQIRQQLHKYIDIANEKDIAAMYLFMEQKSVSRDTYSEEELNEFYKRREKFMKGESKGYSVEEVHNYLRQGKSGL